MTDGLQQLRRLIAHGFSSMLATLLAVVHEQFVYIVYSSSQNLRFSAYMICIDTIMLTLSFAGNQCSK